ncbi:NUDIX domain-containing protein [Streptomyces sp. NPDC049970]|uniref:nucleotide triphosphate diphosphatase NUDT15 n=1 Tax=Streptomyces sp. NPDC049970 TaxID=3155033 RepID=UPI003438157F
MDSADAPTRNSRPPLVQAAFGVGVVVQDEQGRILLGRHRSGTWELPGGKIDPTHESVAAAAARELREETGLRVPEEAVDVFAMLHDVVGGINRISMAALVTVASAVPRVTEPHLVGEWRWTAPDELPGALFHPSAQILAVWRPDLDIPHPAAHHLPIAATRPSGPGDPGAPYGN